jgi:hypothetical protein
VDAWRRLRELEAVPPGDLDTFDESQPEWKELAERFPELGGRLEAAGKDWLARTINTALLQAEERCPRAPEAVARRLLELRKWLRKEEQRDAVDRVARLQVRAFRERLRAANAECSSHLDAGRMGKIERLVGRVTTDWTGLVASTDAQGELSAFQRKWTEAVVKYEVGRSEALLAKGDLDGAAERLREVVRRNPGRAASVSSALLAPRRRILLARLRQARKELHALLTDERDRYGEVAALRAGLERTCSEEVTAVGTVEDRQAFQAILDSCSAVVKIARTAGKLE